MPQPACPFCEIDRERNLILFETDNVFVTLSNPRLMPGHTLVIPKVHVSSFAELARLNKAVLVELHDTAAHFQEKIIRLIAPGCDYSQHNRPFMPMTKRSIPGHLHIHLRPRSWEDEYYEKVDYYETPLFRHPDAEELRKFQEMLRE